MGCSGSEALEALEVEAGLATCGVEELGIMLGRGGGGAMEE